ncbi:MAG: hypothetical protein Q4F28_04835 [Eubacteriales bacterium]|nr:hypothetical protein [Eubacteriales bacterium]
MNENTRKILEKCMTIEAFMRLSPDERTELLKEENGKMLSTKNSFLGKADDVRFEIFDLPCLLTCPERTDICEKSCYEISVEKMHKGEGRDSAIVIHRKMNWFLSLQDDFVDKMVRKLERLRPKPGQQIYVRLHASGDFYSEEYLRKWMKIALRLRLKGKDYVFSAYTKSLIILDHVLSDQKKLAELYAEAYEEIMNEAPPMKREPYRLEDFNLHIIGSLMDDSEKEQNKISIIDKYSLPKYIATDQMEKVNMDCSRITCAECKRCYTFPMKNVCSELR